MNGHPIKAPKVICIGLSALDHIWQADRLPDADLSKVRAESYEIKGGGMAATASVAVSRLGGTVCFWGRAGNDPAGHIMREQLQAEGVDTADFRLFDGARSSVSGVFVDKSGERHIINFRGADLPVSADWLPLDEIEGASSVLSDPRWPEGTVATFSAARRAGIATILDGDVADSEVFERILPLTDHAVFSEAALRGFAGADAPTALRMVEERFACRVSAVTLGEAGVIWREDGVERQLPAFAVDVVDTNGAGDVFHGAYAFAIGDGMQVDAAMKFASAAAALKCLKPDGRSGIPTLEEVIQFQRTHP